MGILIDMCAPFTAFLFAATDGRASASDIKLDRKHLSRLPLGQQKPLVADRYAGLSFGITHWHMTCAPNYRTIELF